MSAKKTLLYEFSSFLGMILIVGLCFAFSWVLYDRIVDTFTTLDTYVKSYQHRYKEETLKFLMVVNHLKIRSLCYPSQPALAQSTHSP
jgi:hypothetical protein